ncbi:MAG TPA: nucleoside hydrolase [Abditibacteriaceae bacterium]
MPLHAQEAPGLKKTPVRVIFDTDMQSDVDDVGAMAVLHALADRGEIEILGTMVSVTYLWSVPCVDAINHFYGRPDLPLGTVKGKGVLRSSSYARQIAQEFPHDMETDNAPDAIGLYRKILAAQPDKSVVILTVGYLTNLAGLLDSGPDQWSNLKGRDLVQQKVKNWVCMGGIFPKGLETNLRYDAPSSAKAINEWPTPIIFTGWEIGKDLMTGHTLKEKFPPTNLVRRAYELYLGPNKTQRESWDQSAVLLAARGLGDYWDVATGGSLHVLPDGSNEWRLTPVKDHSYVIKKMNPLEVAAVIEELMTQPPRWSKR